MENLIAENKRTGKQASQVQNWEGLADWEIGRAIGRVMKRFARELYEGNEIVVRVEPIIEEEERDSREPYQHYGD